MLENRVLIAETIWGEPFRELEVGRVSMTHIINTDHLTVHLRHEHYLLTTDLVYAVRKHDHLYSSWPQVYHALAFLRQIMVLDDLARI